MDTKLEDVVLRALKEADCPLGVAQVSVGASVIAPGLGVGQAQTSKALKALVAAGKVTRSGYGRWTEYSLPSLVTLEGGRGPDVDTSAESMEETL